MQASPASRLQGWYTGVGLVGTRRHEGVFEIRGEENARVEGFTSLREEWGAEKVWEGKREIG